MSVPVGLGFGTDPGNIRVFGDGQGIRKTSDLIDTSSGLRVQPNQTLALVGGDIVLSRGTLKTTGGQIELGSVAGAGLVNLIPTDKGWTLGYSGISAFGEIQLSGAAAVDASGNGGGNIQIQARKLMLDGGSQIESSTLGAGTGGTLKINASDSVNLVGLTEVDSFFNTGISSLVYPRATGAGGNINIETARLNVRDGAGIAAGTYGFGNAGSMEVLAHDSVEVLRKPTAKAGSSITSLAQRGSTGSGGNIKIETARLSLRSGGVISSGTFGQGSGGNVSITADEEVQVTGKSLTGNSPSRISARTGGTGKAGDLTIEAERLTVTDGGRVNIGGEKIPKNLNFQPGQGNAGTLRINADSINLDRGTITAGTEGGTKGQGGDIFLHSGDLQLRDSIITATAGGNGDGGNITINTDILVAIKNSTITANAFEGQGGNIKIDTKGLFLSPDSKITASSRFGLNGTIQKEVQLQAQLHHLSLMLDFEQWLAVESKLGNKKLASLRTRITQQIQPAVDLLLKNHSTFSQLPASYSVYAKLNFSKSLNKIPDQQFHSLAIEYAESALQTARSTNSQRLQSESFGALGELKLEQSQPYFEEALGLAQSVHAWDLAYQWQQKLGILYKEQGKYKEALQAYSAAIENVTLVRNNLSSTNTDLQFSFHEKVEPLYREYMRLLLTDSNPNFSEIIQTNERLQIAELENYLQCRKLNLLAFNEIKNLDTSPTVIHIIDLVDSIEVISQSPKQPLHHHSIESQLIRGHINNLVDTLQYKNLAYVGADVILDHSQALYNLLIAPIKYLPTSGTLVFTLDASLQSLPMGLFHDGKNYLIERYGITGTLGSRMQPPKLLKQKQLKAFIAGLSKISPSFYAPNAPKGLKVLPGVEVEIANVKKGITSSKVLLNEDFVSPMLDKELSTDDFSIIHLTTHAQFSSVPDRTMIFAWDKPITVSEFNDLLKEKTQSSQEGIELLVLSACQTAKGNKRSALGMAGVAVQAGARSTIATLWQVDADSSALLMKEFYQRLKDGLTKVEALRLAQLQLISNPQYQHPSHWAAFLLIGGWL